MRGRVYAEELCRSSESCKYTHVRDLYNFYLMHLKIAMNIINVMDLVKAHCTHLEIDC